MLHIIGTIGTAGGTGSVIEFCGSVFEQMSMEGRMTVCNMSIEAGARAGMVAPDEITFEYIKGRPLAPSVETGEWDKAVEFWKTLKTDPGAHFDRSVDIDAKDIMPTLTWGTSPQDVVPIAGAVPDPEKETDERKKSAMLRSLEYMGLQANTQMEDISIDKASHSISLHSLFLGSQFQQVFIGSCTNARIEDLRAASIVVKGRRVAAHVDAMIVPGSGLVRKQAEKEGLDRIFIDAGFDWREAGCSMCLGMNPDQLKAGERCASTSNRNFEGRQGAGGRTHLMSPAMAAAAAIAGKFIDVRKFVDQTPVDQPDAKRPKMETDIASEDSAQQPSEAPVDEVTDGEAQSAAAPSEPVAVPAGVPKFTTLKGFAAPLAKSNVDTDAIIPKVSLCT